MTEQTEQPDDAPEPDPLEIFERTSNGRPVCRVCGALVPAEGGYQRVHWDWHEAANGA